MSKPRITEVSVAIGTKAAADWADKTKEVVDEQFRDARPEDVSRATRHVSMKFALLLPPDLLSGPPREAVAWAVPSVRLHGCQSSQPFVDRPGSPSRGQGPMITAEHRSLREAPAIAPGSGGVQALR